MKQPLKISRRTHSILACIMCQMNLHYKIISAHSARMTRTKSYPITRILINLKKLSPTEQKVKRLFKFSRGCFKWLTSVPYSVSNLTVDFSVR